MITVRASALVPGWVHEGCFPEADEDGLTRLAETWSTHADALDERADDLDAGFRRLAGTFTGPTADTATTQVADVRDFLTSTGEGCRELADATAEAARVITFAKTAVNTVLLSLQTETIRVVGGALTSPPVATVVKLRQLQLAARAQIRGIHDAVVQRVGALAPRVDVQPALTMPRGTTSPYAPGSPTSLFSPGTGSGGGGAGLPVAYGGPGSSGAGTPGPGGTAPGPDGEPGPSSPLLSPGALVGGDPPPPGEEGPFPTDEGPLSPEDQAAITEDWNQQMGSGSPGPGYGTDDLAEDATSVSPDGLLGGPGADDAQPGSPGQPGGPGGPGGPPQATGPGSPLPTGPSAHGDTARPDPTPVSTAPTGPVPPAPGSTDTGGQRPAPTTFSPEPSRPAPAPEPVRSYPGDYRPGVPASVEPPRVDPAPPPSPGPDRWPDRPPAAVDPGPTAPNGPPASGYGAEIAAPETVEPRIPGTSAAGVAPPTAAPLPSTFAPPTGGPSPFPSTSFDPTPGSGGPGSGGPGPGSAGAPAAAPGGPAGPPAALGPSGPTAGPVGGPVGGPAPSGGGAAPVGPPPSGPAAAAPAAPPAPGAGAPGAGAPAAGAPAAQAPPPGQPAPSTAAPSGAPRPAPVVVAPVPGEPEPGAATDPTTGDHDPAGGPFVALAAGLLPLTLAPLLADLGRPGAPLTVDRRTGTTLLPTQFGPEDVPLATRPAGMGVAYQKALAPGEAEALVSLQSTTLRGLVHPLDQVRDLRTPAELRSALGLDAPGADEEGRPEAVFDRAATEIEVLRFSGLHDADLIVPVAPDVERPNSPIPLVVRDHARPWTGSGEAPGSTTDALIEEFEVLGELRHPIPHLAEIWRLAADGTAQHLATFNARTGTWSTTTARPRPLPGEQTENGPVAVLTDGRHSTTNLSAYEQVLISPARPGQPPPTGFEPAPDGTLRRVVPVTAATTVAVITIGRWRDARVSVLRHAGSQSLIDYAGDSADQASALGLRRLGQGHWQQRWVPTAELSEVTVWERPYPVSPATTESAAADAGPATAPVGVLG